MTLHHGDCLEVMAGMEPESVDAIVTDPPYGLEFMGKEWDRLDGGLPQENVWKGRRGKGGSSIGTDDSKPQSRHHVGYGGGQQGFKRCATCGKRAFSGSPCQCAEPVWVMEYAQLAPSSAIRMGRWHEAWAREAYRVAKPSAYLLAFGGTRTVHRMTCAIEDAGWVIRDMLVWAYASGFPKSKASLKPAWEPIVMARKPGPLRMLAIDACRIGMDGGTRSETRGDPTGVTYAAGSFAGEFGERVPNLGRWPANVILTATEDGRAIFDGGVEGVVGGGETSSGSRSGAYAGSGAWSGEYGPVTRDVDGDSGTYSRFFLIPKSSRSDREPVLDEYAYQLHKERGECKPTRRARATGGDTTRDASAWSTTSSGSASEDPSPTDGKSITSTATSPTTGLTTSSPSIPSPISGSIPAVSSEMESGGSPAVSVVSTSPSANPTGISPLRAGPSTGDADPATSRSSFARSGCVVCGKPLPRFSTHPTQKPTDLMRHLVRLVTPSGGIVLDPFLGSGTTAIAAEMEGFAWVGIEREAEYVAIAEARLNGVQRGLGLEAS